MSASVFLKIIQYKKRVSYEHAYPKISFSGKENNLEGFFLQKNREKSVEDFVWIEKLSLSKGVLLTIKDVKTVIMQKKGEANSVKKQTHTEII
ncbi:MAG: hypothetical protein QRY72_04350 [Candidatus Rhabdochlamydia sp.]